MLDTISIPRPELSKYAPRVTVIQIDTEKIRDVIGTGGKNIRKIVEESGAEIDIHEDGNIFISAIGAESAQKAQQMIENLVHDVQVGEIYDGTVTRILKFGAFIELLPGKEGLCHISQLANDRVEKVEDVVNIGDKLKVKVTDIDNRGRINVSHKVLL